MLTRYQERDLAWIDLVAPTPAEIRALMEEFSLAPQVAQELLSASYKSKVERHGDAIYAILHFPTLRLGLNRRPEQEIDFIIGKKFLITTRYENIDPLHTFAKAFEVGTLLGRNHSAHGGHLFAHMTQNLYRSLSDECDLVRARMEEIESRIFKGDEKRMVYEISHVSRALYDFARALEPHKEMLGSLEPVAARLFGPEYAHYLREVDSSRGRAERQVHSMQGSLEILRRTNDSLLNTKQNEIMKTLTILAFVTFPLTLISSVFGMNTSYIPIVGVSGDFWYVIGIMVSLAACFFVYFKYKDWL